ncbi:MAG: hypothetical protein V4668_03960 [Patescibacteria group bacterium]
MTEKRRPSTVPNGTEQNTRGNTVPKSQKILMVSNVDILDVISEIIELDITLAANYEEAIERLKERSFDHVITDAVLPNQKSGLDILRFTRKAMPDAKVVVFHNEDSCVVDNRTWFIKTCLRAHFPKAEFKKTSIPYHLSELLPKRHRA